jgi:hypothetical protein
MITRMVPIFLRDWFWNGGLSVFKNRVDLIARPFCALGLRVLLSISRAVGHLDVSVDSRSDAKLIIRGLTPPLTFRVQGRVNFRPFSSELLHNYAGKRYFLE